MNPCSDEEYYYKLDNMVLSSCQILRNAFTSRWKTETGEDRWIDDLEHIERFFALAGQNAFKKAQPFQKTALKENCVKDWDISLLSVVLLNFGDPKKYSTENQAVQNLKKMRNYLAHHPTKKIDKNDYNENVEIFKASLKSFGHSNKQINKLIEQTGITSSLKALEYMKDLHQKAEAFQIKGKSDKALGLYSEAVKVPSLLPANLGTAYEKRAECYLKSVKDHITDKEKYTQALVDATKAIELNEYSWMAYYLAAQCHRWKNDLGKAISNYEIALAISPAQKQVKNDLDSCKVLHGNISRQDHLNPNMMPMNLEERVKHLENETGIKMKPKEFIDINEKYSSIACKGQDHVFRGHKNFAGWDGPSDFNQAAKHYAKAATLKNAEGMFNLANCYLNGHGVKQDVEEALRLYRETAEMDRQAPGQTTPLGYNVGVAASQHSIGLLYDQGIGVDRDYAEAAIWYKRAMENGVGHGANNLGLLYISGKGVPKDEKMAEMCWKQAINLKDFNAPASLFGYYINQMETEKAKGMVKIGREMGNPELSRMSDEELKRTFEAVNSLRIRIEPEILAFEKSNGLKAKGLTFKQRMNRKEQHLNMNSLKMRKILENSMTMDKSEPQSWGGQVQPFTVEKLAGIQEKAMNGSIVAFQVVTTLAHVNQLGGILEGKEEFTKAEKMEIIDLYHTIAITNAHLLFIFGKSLQKLKSIVASLFEEYCDTKGVDDMKIRLCFVMLNLSGSMTSEDMYGVELLKEGIRRYPDEPNYYEYLSFLFGNKKKYKESRSWSEQGLQKFPNHVELLYCQAVSMRMENESRIEINYEKCVKAYKEFLDVAPLDHRKVPEANYNISFLYSVELRETISKDTLKQVESYYKRGLEAEKYQLPCYLPYGESDIKRMLEVLISTLHGNFPKADVKIEPDMETSVLEKKEYLKSPTRKGLILKHREILKDLQEKYEEDKRKNKKPGGTTEPPKFKQMPAKKLSLVKPITLIDMNPTEDHIFENRVLELTIMEDPNPYFPSIHLIAEDENGDTTRLYIYSVDRSTETLEKFKAGCRLAILNPYMRIGAITINNGIRNDEPRCVVYLEKVEQMCRFCGEENAAHKCSKCKRPYCSRECQMLDWKELNHKLICSLKY